MKEYTTRLPYVIHIAGKEIHGILTWNSHVIHRAKNMDNIMKMNIIREKKKKST